MLPPALTPSHSADQSSHPQVEGNPHSPNGITYHTTDRQQVPIRLTSIKSLRSLAREALHSPLTETFASLTYIGLVDPSRRLAAMQSGVNLYLIDYGLISNELFYQIGITDFGNFGAIHLRPSNAEPLPLRDILLVAAELEVSTDASMKGLSPMVIAQKVYDHLFSKREMLKEYFSLEIDEQGNLLTIPLLIKGYMPCMGKLPTFLLRLGPFVTWTDEMECFRTFLVELAGFYVPEKLPQVKVSETKGKMEFKLASSLGKGADGNGDMDVEMDDQPGPGPDLVVEAEIKPDSSKSKSNSNGDTEDPYIAQRRQEIEYALEHILFPAFRSRLLATQGMVHGVVEVANLKGLYRVFERC